MKWNDGNLIAFGFVIGAISAGVVTALDPFNAKLFFGNDGRLQWETLLTGFAAVAVAFATILKLNEQITRTERIATDQRERRARAARATLPLAQRALRVAVVFRAQWGVGAHEGRGVRLGNTSCA